jgi:catechol 2,3-dioxygenase-like lactoylglutathione lyase family enzyme
MAFMLTTLAHICLHVHDLASTRRFYGELLGMPVAFEFERKGVPFGYYLQVDAGHFIEVFLTDKSPADGPARIAHFCLETSDLNGLRARLTAAGHGCTEPKLGADHSWQFWCKDPDGNNIEFHQYTEESLQFKGGVAHVDW